MTPLPDDVSFAAGATLGIPGMTAWCCLFGDGPIAGQTVLVTGGAGAVGHYAVQLAKWGGARVIATVSSAPKAEQARLARRRSRGQLQDRGRGRQGAWPSPNSAASTAWSMSTSAAISLRR